MNRYSQIAHEAGKMDVEGSFYLCALPTIEYEVLEFYSSPESELKTLLASPPRIRKKYGFDYRFDSAPKLLLNGKLLRAMYKGYVVQDLWRNGTLSLVYTLLCNDNYNSLPTTIIIP